MNKLFIISLLLITILAHKQLDRQSKKSKDVSFQSANVLLENVGDQDIKQDPLVEANTSDDNKPHRPVAKKQTNNLKSSSKKLHPKAGKEEKKVYK